MSPQFGLFINTGEMLGTSHQEVFELAIAQVDLAERLSYHDTWVTEHHFIPFGINSSALTFAAYLLGRTRSLRIGTAVTLAPLLHPLQLAEQVAILDQTSRGRFDLGVGRGGYLREFEKFAVPVSRWDEEVEATLASLLATFDAKRAPDSLRPSALTQPHPPLFVASSSPASLALAARNSLPLLHYFATPIDARVSLQQKYHELSDGRVVQHVHAIIVVVTDDEARVRRRLHESLAQSFRDGDFPSVPQAANRHRTPDGKPADPAQMAAAAADGAIVGSPEVVADRLRDIIRKIGPARFALFTEAVADRSLTLESIERFASEVVPLLK